MSEKTSPQLKETIQCQNCTRWLDKICTLHNIYTASNFSCADIIFKNEDENGLQTNN